jgi:hypothetical protein
MSGSDDLVVEESSFVMLNDGFCLIDLGPVGGYFFPRIRNYEHSSKIFFTEDWLVDSYWLDRVSFERGDRKWRESLTLLLRWYLRIESFPVTEKFSLACFMLGFIA